LTNLDISSKITEHLQKYPDISITVKKRQECMDDDAWVRNCRILHLNRWRVFKVKELTGNGIELTDIPGVIFYINYFELA
jgi:hypothetical protein